MEKELTKHEEEFITPIEEWSNEDLNNLLAESGMNIKEMQLYRLEILNELNEKFYAIVGDNGVANILSLLSFDRIFKDEYEKAQEDGDFFSMMYALIIMDITDDVNTEMEHSLSTIH